MLTSLLKAVPLFIILFACAQPQPYVASRAILDKLQPGREIIPARKGCDTCHKIFAQRLTDRYYPVRISHKTHTGLGIECIFCHRAASSSTQINDYLMPEGHGFVKNPFDKAPRDTQDKNPCRACHLYSSDFGKKDRLIPAACNTCHPSYSDKKPLPFIWWQRTTNLINNHSTHYSKGIPCLRCHPGFDMMDSTTLNFTPKMDICNECHAGGERKEAIKVDEADPFKAAKLLFSQNCAMCHGIDGKGGGAIGRFFKAGLRPRDLTDTSYMSKRTDWQLHEVILKGGPELGLSERMPAWEGLLGEGAVTELVRYIRYISGTPSK